MISNLKLGYLKNEYLKEIMKQCDFILTKLPFSITSGLKIEGFQILLYIFFVRSSIHFLGNSYFLIYFYLAENVSQKIQIDFEKALNQ